MSKYRICAIVPCWKRPARTRRIINNILAQDINNWEAFVVGDGCSQFQTLFESGEAKFYQDIAASKGNKLHMFNLEKNYGGFGYHIINHAIKNNNSNYIVILGNDDIIAPDHFRHYLSEIENTDYEMLGYKTYLNFLPPTHALRPRAFPGEAGPEACIPGHGEIIVKSDIARLFEIGSNFGHDWDFVHKIYKRGKSKMAKSGHFTYFITHTTHPIFHSDIPVKFENID